MFQSHHLIIQNSETRVFWINIAKSKLNLRYRNCWNLFGILRRETEFQYCHCQNSTKSMREKKKKVERENVEFRQRGYRNSSSQFYCQVWKVCVECPKWKKKKKNDKLIVAMPLPKFNQKDEREEEKGGERKYWISTTWILKFLCPILLPDVRGVLGVPKVKRKKKIDKLIVAMPLPK